MPADRSDAACTVIIMTGTSGRATLAFGKSSRPVIPGMLMSETASTALRCSPARYAQRYQDQRCPRRITGL